MNKIRRLVQLYQQAVGYWGYLTPVFDLAVRLYVSSVFFRSGLVKIQSWDSTVSLFENEYAVPVLPPEMAAWMAATTELSIPVFLVLGLLSRPAAIVLFVFNAIAVISYPDLSPAGVKQHYLWGALMLVIVFHGAGKFSLDAWIKNYFR
ncbi:MAG TPA: DoxX family protein [Gallionella sp.]|nr:DoxX family protein [Gallionella sp.]